MNITVIICTSNRCQTLAETLDSVLASQLPEQVEWEVLVVDNNSRDQTRKVVEGFAHRYLGRIRYVFEPQQGKSYALNAGIREARGEILAFTHDDVTVGPTWLQKLTGSLQDRQWSGAGGPVQIQWPASLPSWLSPSGAHPHHGLSGFDLARSTEELLGAPVGANMAFRKSVFERHGGFRNDLEPRSSRGTPLIGEETEFGQRLILAGKRICYIESAIVHHPVPDAKISKPFLLAAAFDWGRVSAHQSPVGGVRLASSLAAWTLRWMVSFNPPTRFFCKTTVWEKAGAISESRRIAHEKKKKNALRAEEIRRNNEKIAQDTWGHLDLKAGDWVQVRTQEEILATLDERGRLGNLPFMPEMLQYCGKQFRVHRRTDKSCDNIEPWSIRRMTHAVVLEGLRCDGQRHGGCQAACMIFWKEAWLKRAARDVVPTESLLAPPKSALCTVETILDASSHTDPQGETVYSCQATEVLTYTSYMPSWDPRQYIRDLRSRNLATGLAEDSGWGRALEMALGSLRIMRSITLSVYNTIQDKRPRRPTYPFLGGTAPNTPLEVLNLQPGELVQIRSRQEIIATLDKNDRNRGLLFDGGMLTHCGGIYRVLRRVHRIVDEKTGKMMEMKNPCIALEGVTCMWDYHRLCPRDTCTPYWREGWLRRAVDLPAPLTAEQIAETCGKC